MPKKHFTEAYKLLEKMAEAHATNLVLRKKLLVEIDFQIQKEKEVPVPGSTERIKSYKELRKIVEAME